MRASDYLGPRGPLAAALPSYEHRPSQMSMADVVEDALGHGGVALVEAGTGTGKTLAYLVPAILSGRRVVISTGTRALQDQIMDSDLPFLEKHLGVRFKAACLKGLSNYLCLRRFEEFRKSAVAGVPPVSRQLPIVEAWRHRTSSGERVDLRELEEGAAVWSYVQSGSDTRIGQKCTYYESCFVTKARRAADAADVLVVNHHLFFADLAMRGPHGGQVLPDYDAVIFDEAHQVEDIATHFFGTSVSTGKVERLARDTEAVLAACGGDVAMPRCLRDASDAFFMALPDVHESRAPLPREVFDEALEARFFALDDALEALSAHCRLKRSDGAARAVDARHEHSESLGQMARRAGAMRDELARVADGASARAVPWIGRRGRGISIGVSPVSVGDVLRRELFEKTDAVVLTSATLTTARSVRSAEGGEAPFSFLRSRLGIDFEVDEVALPSPFDYGAQAGLYLARDLPDPRSPRFLMLAAEEVLSLVDITGGGAFVLCTSRRAMHGLSQECRSVLKDRGHEVMVQGEAPKASLLERFRNAGDAVLFATASFWEGIDVPGDALRLVIIDKLPFQVPSDPLVKARCENLEEKGGKPFMDLLVPTAALSLKQGFGRLIRSRRDHGLVALLDPRVLQKGYGRVFLDSLPPASRCHSLDEARAFWDSLGRVAKLT